VYIVPDSDWYENGSVLAQAMFCRSFLRRLGVAAQVAAPPPAPDGSKRGIDDHLQHGGALSELEVLEREAHYGLAEFIAQQRRWRRDKVVRGAEVLESLALHAGSDGRLYCSLRSIARIMGCHHSKVERAIRDLEECGAVEIDGSLDSNPKHYDRKNGWVGWEWNERPAITITPLLRAKDTRHRLGN
jgi:Helix-turn-helix domain